MEDAEVVFEPYEEGQDLCQPADFRYLSDNFYKEKNNEQNQ